MSDNTTSENEIVLSLQSYEEQRIHHFEENGEEKYMKNLTDEEQFASMISRFDFVINHNPGSNSVNNVALQRPKLREPLKMNPWIKPREYLYDALSQFDALTTVTETMKMREESFISSITIHEDDEHEDEESDWHHDPEYANRMYRSKQNQLDVASSIVKKGAQQLKDKMTKDRTFLNQISQLQRRWVVKPSKHAKKQHIHSNAYSSNAIIGNTVPTIDLSNSNAVLPIFSYIPVVILRTKHNKLDLQLPAICTYGKKIVVASRLIKNQIYSNFDQILEAAQKSVFNLELFSLCLECLMHTKSTDYEIVEHTDFKILVKLDSLIYITIKLVPDTNSLFWDIDCSVQLPDRSSITTDPSEINGQYVHCLLLECLTNLHESHKKTNTNSKVATQKNTASMIVLPSINNAKFAKKCIKAFSNVMKHVNHRYYCQQIVKHTLQCPDYSNIILEATKFPSTTSYRLTLKSNVVYTLVVNGTRTVIQRRPKAIPVQPKQSDNKELEYNVSGKGSRLLEFDSPAELAEFISLT